jgi:NADH-quinone oxidoreductase subunit M
MAGLFYMYSTYSTFSCFYVCRYPVLTSRSGFLSFLIFLSFGVKLPVYGLHYWLPIAHVEAPTFGSIILAGVLLKLGGAGLIRFLNFLDLEVLAHALTRYLLFFLVFSTLVCCFQSDFKRMVAYSSVSHIIAVPLVLLTGYFVGFKVVVLLIFFHGLRSPVLFSLVGVLYSIYSTRQLALLRGLLLLSPLLSFVCILSFLFTLSAPPYVSFFSEVFFFVYVVLLSPLSLGFLLLFAFLSLVYNLNWLSRLLFRKLYYRVSLRSSFVNFAYLLPITYFHVLSFFILFLVPAV